LRLFFFRPFTFENFLKKFREKSTNNNASPTDLVVEAGSCWVVPIAGFRGSNFKRTSGPLFFAPAVWNHFFQKSADVKKLRAKTPSEWRCRLGRGSSSSYFGRNPRFMELPRGTAGCLKSKIHLLSTEQIMPPCHKAPTHTKYRIPSPVRFPFPGGGLGIARWVRI
jgi:hypothetical protein